MCKCLIVIGSGINSTFLKGSCREKFYIHYGKWIASLPFIRVGWCLYSLLVKLGKSLPIFIISPLSIRPVWILNCEKLWLMIVFVFFLYISLFSLLVCLLLFSFHQSFKGIFRNFCKYILRTIMCINWVLFCYRLVLFHCSELSKYCLCVISWRINYF